MDHLARNFKGRKLPSGAVDYRLVRRRLLAKVEAGELPKADVCDAQRELLRIAANCSDRVDDPCPICATKAMVHARFVFGPRLPPGGRVVSSPQELDRLVSRSGDHQVYLVEVCLSCRWNALLRKQAFSNPKGTPSQSGRSKRRSPGGG